MNELCTSFLLAKSIQFFEFQNRLNWMNNFGNKVVTKVDFIFHRDFCVTAFSLVMRSHELCASHDCANKSNKQEKNLSTLKFK